MLCIFVRIDLNKKMIYMVDVRKKNVLLGLMIVLLSAIFILTQCSFENKDTSGREVKQIFPQRFIPQVPNEMIFADEKVPTDRWHVYEAFDRELLYNYNSPGNIAYVMKLSFRYFPFIEQRLKDNGIPDDFKYLCVAESNLQNQVSRVGAAGFWQFMKETASGYNLEVNDSIDERYDLVKSTDAACKYFLAAYQKFGNWTAAAASYNCGMAGYANFSTYQQFQSFYDIQLPDETNKYIYRILTFKYLMSNSKRMGLDINEQSGYQPLKTKSIKVETTITNLAEWARENNTTYKFIKILNPWLRGRSLPVLNGKTYTIKVLDN